MAANTGTRTDAATTEVRNVDVDVHDIWPAATMKNGEAIRSRTANAAVPPMRGVSPDRSTNAKRDVDLIGPDCQNRDVFPAHDVARQHYVSTNAKMRVISVRRACYDTLPAASSDVHGGGSASP
jgi:hypothetical protein